MSGLKRQIKQGSRKLSLDGRTPREEFDACRLELQDQSTVLTGILNQELLPALADVGPSDPPIQGIDPGAAAIDAHLLRAIGQAHPDPVWPWIRSTPFPSSATWA